MAPSQSARQSNLSRLLVTLGVVVAYLMGMVLPLPGLNWSDIPGDRSIFAHALDYSNFSVGTLGVAPLISGFLVVEILAFLVPPWRSLRNGSEPGRRKLVRASWLTALAVVVAQGFGISKAMHGPSGTFPVSTAELIIAYLTWTVVLYGLAYWAERSGAIGGIPTLLLAQIVFVHLKLWIGDESPSISSLLVQMGGVAFALPLLIGPDELIKRTPSEGATRQELLFPWLVAGMIPVTLAMAFLGWPALISAWLGASSPMREVTALLDEYPWWTLLIVAAAGLIFAPDFYRIGVLRRLDELLGLASESYPAEKSRFFRTRNLYLGYLSLIWFFALAAWSKGIPIDLATPFILVALCLDGASLLIFRALSRLPHCLPMRSCLLGSSDHTGPAG